jgi:hypothetical protein
MQAIVTYRPKLSLGEALEAFASYRDGMVESVYFDVAWKPAFLEAKPNELAFS